MDLFPNDVAPNPNNLYPRRLYRSRRRTEISASDIDILANMGGGGGVDPNGLMPKPEDTAATHDKILGVKNGDWVPIPERMPLVPSVPGDEDKLWVAKNKNEWVQLNNVLRPSYVHTTVLPSQEWVIEHGLNLVEPRIVVVGTDAVTTYMGSIDRTKTTPNKSVILFGVALAGKAFIIG